MFSTATENYGFPQWEPQDHADFINDMNPAYKTIDTSLRTTSDTAKQTWDIVKTLQPIVEKNTNDIATNAQDIVNANVNMANIQHQVTDNKTAIAQNASDISVLQEDNHTIHGDINTHLTKYNTLLNWAQTNAKKTMNGTATIGSKEVTVSAEIDGHVVTANVNMTGVTLPAGATSYPITWSYPDDIHNPVFQGVRNCGWVFATPVTIIPAMFDGSNLAFINTTSADISISAGTFSFSTTVLYDEIVSADNALKSLNQEVTA